jgi:hypothetical protein
VGEACEGAGCRLNFGALGSLHAFLNRPERLLPAAADLADGRADTPEGEELVGLVGMLMESEGWRWAATRTKSHSGAQLRS